MREIHIRGVRAAARVAVIFFGLGVFLQDAVSQSRISLGEFDSVKIFIHQPGEISRFGRGIIVPLISEYSFMTAAEWRYFSCDGRYISDEYGSEFLGNDELKGNIDLLISKINDVRQKPSPYINEIIEHSESTFAAKNEVRRLLPQLCAKAKPEPRGILWPFVKSQADKKSTSEVTSVMSGYGKRTGDVVDGWFQENYSSTEVMKNSNGEPIMRPNGTPRTFSRMRSDLGQSKTRVSVNCRTNQIAILSVNKTDEYGRVVRSGSFDADRPTYSAAVPQSVGEAMVEILCRLY